MCGRYASSRPSNDLATLYGADGSVLGASWKGSYSIPPTAAAPVVVDRESDGTVSRELREARWGLRPHWLDAKRPGFHNARLETVAEKPAFRSSFAKHRVLVPMDGYFEWVATPEKMKQPFYISDAGGAALSAAGLVAFLRDGEDWLATYTIITREARDASGEVHDRMPVFLGEQAWADWLAPLELDKSGVADALDMLRAESEQVAATLTTHPVSMAVNHVRTADPRDPALVEPVELPA